MVFEAVLEDIRPIRVLTKAATFPVVLLDVGVG